MALDPEVLGWLREATADPTSWQSIAGALRQHDPEGNDGRVRPFVFAFDYPLHEQYTARRERAGEPFGANVAGPDWRYPPPVAEIPDGDVKSWQDAFAALDGAAARARLGDLLWIRRRNPAPHLAAQGACDALLVVAADRRWRGMDRVTCLSRALELAIETNDQTRVSRVTAAMVTLAEEDLGSTGGGPGVALGAIRPAVMLPESRRPPGLDELLQRVLARYGKDPFIFDSVAKLRIQLLNAEERVELRREQVQRWRDEAAQATGMLRLHGLEQALEIARTYGLIAETEELRRELSTIGPDELDLKTISATVSLPVGEVERFLASFDQAESWQQAFAYLAAQPPPGRLARRTCRDGRAGHGSCPTPIPVPKGPDRTRDRQPHIPCGDPGRAPAPGTGRTPRPIHPHVGIVLQGSAATNRAAS